MKEIHEMDVYRLGEKLSDMIWHDYDTWPEKARRTIGYQAIDAADSIAANLAEGFGRFSMADRRMFYRYARGSFEETKCWLRKLIRRGLISTPERVEEYKAVIDELGPKLNTFIRATKAPVSSFKDQVSGS
jgi:four helix bundle protein